MLECVMTAPGFYVLASRYDNHSQYCNYVEFIFISKYDEELLRTI